ncbi:MAG: hypothetical protein LBS56_00990 [Propionibacteriaceae bacterium]|jgi:hypothetical protein|nr:hypothetical protein [Propionibacteriaceae bacterium]
MGKPEALIEAVAQDLAAFQMADEGVSLGEALDRLYESVTFDKLSDPETGLYLNGSAYVYELLRDELRVGHFIQVEV